MVDFPQIFASGAIHPRTLIGMSETLEPVVRTQVAMNTAGDTVVLRSPYGRRWRVRLSNDGNRVHPIANAYLLAGDQVIYWATARFGEILPAGPAAPVVLEREAVPGSVAALDVVTGAAVEVFHGGGKTWVVDAAENPVHLSYRPVLDCVVTVEPTLTSQVTGLSQGFDLELTERRGFPFV